MKIFTFVFAVFISFVSKAQISDSTRLPQIYFKANALFLPVGIINAGAEYQLNNKITVQADIFISPWKSFNGRPMQIYIAGLDARYYFKEAFKNWYLGANIAASRYIMQKWNYWSDGPYQYTPESPVYIASDLYQVGFSTMFGATAGYQFQLSDRWNMDLFLGGGNVQSFYKGMHKKLGIRYDTDPTRDYNRSGEWLIYRGGVMIAYKLKS
ncbi:Protein of unknown function [Kaistella treverensis]|uniref:DUF3575 domain-containing protein n=1 Tax=Kaistella treverensis TaxID=631455 RepID=A0A1I3NMV7_9FLAO|nr:DUF3575 domain-containing protein [Kaistella treverensis]SFJ10492.1 Protein of unknown function [Kaistella treverensis]